MSATDAAVPAGHHPLQDKWAFWCQKKQRRAGTGPVNWFDGMTCVGTFNTVEGFWSMYSHILRPEAINASVDFMLFREGIKPMWEDEANAHGGKFALKLRKGSTTAIWEELLLALIGEALPSSSDICGAVLSIRYHDDALAIWNRSAEDDAVATHRSALTRALHIPPHVEIDYTRHRKLHHAPSGSAGSTPATGSGSGTGDEAGGKAILSMLTGAPGAAGATAAGGVGAAGSSGGADSAIAASAIMAAIGKPGGSVGAAPGSAGWSGWGAKPGAGGTAAAAPAPAAATTTAAAPAKGAWGKPAPSADAPAAAAPAAPAATSSSSPAPPAGSWAARAASASAGGAVVAAAAAPAAVAAAPATRAAAAAAGTGVRSGESPAAAGGARPAAITGTGTPSKARSSPGTSAPTTPGAAPAVSAEPDGWHTVSGRRA